MRQFNLIFFVLVFLSSAKAEKIGHSWNLYLENDGTIIGGPGTDEGYSNGVKFSFVYGTDKIPFWSDVYSHLFKIFRYRDHEGAVVNYGVSLGHQIYTPEDISEENLIADDRPYAAWLSLGFSTAIRYKENLHLWNLSLGVIGPAARGEGVQREVHQQLDVPEPQGWKNQLKDEGTLQLYYQQRLKFWSYQPGKIAYLDAIPYWGGSLGNVLIDVNAGLLMRLGYRLDGDFGPTRPSASEVDGMVNPYEVSDERFGTYAFVSYKGSAIARNIFLDGNTFRNSHNVDHIPYVDELEGGVSLRYKRVSTIWRYVTRGPEFKERRNSHSFASVSLLFQQKF